MIHPYAYPSYRWPSTSTIQTQDRDSKSTEPSYYYTCDKEKGVLEVELPGVKKENIDIELHGHHLSIAAKRYKKGEEGKKELLCSYDLDLRLGHDADMGNVKGVSCQDGVLIVHIPTLKKEQPRRITISS